MVAALEKHAGRLIHTNIIHRTLSEPIGVDTTHMTYGYLCVTEKMFFVFFLNIPLG